MGAHRCFEMNYIIALLSFGYGFPDNVRAFHFVNDIDGHDVEWSLGAFLYAKSQGGYESYGAGAGSGAGAILLEAMDDYLMTGLTVLMISLAVFGVLRRRRHSTLYELLSNDPEKMA